MRNRRVGTFTLGLSLIAAGILSILALFSKFTDIITVMRLSPIVLVLLGAEILISSLLNNDNTFKIDGWSIFLILILISGTLLSTAAVVYADRFITRF